MGTSEGMAVGGCVCVRIDPVQGRVSANSNRKLTFLFSLKKI